MSEEDEKSEREKTEEIIVDMLTENTGVHMLDSGSAYGRHWEENKKYGEEVEKWKERPETRVDIDAKHETIMVTSDIFHYLRYHVERTEKASELEKKFYEYAEQDRFERESWCQIMRELFGSNSITNTYNHETHLGQTLQYAMISEEEAEKFLNEESIAEGFKPDLYDMRYIILQIHNGCDVRGGYTKPRVFEIGDPTYFLMHQTDIYASCECSQGHSDDAGYHWYEMPDFEFKEIEGEDKVVCSECGGVVSFSCPMAW